MDVHEVNIATLMLQRHACAYGAMHRCRLVPQAAATTQAQPSTLAHWSARVRSFHTRSPLAAVPPPHHCYSPQHAAARRPYRRKRLQLRAGLVRRSRPAACPSPGRTHPNLPLRISTSP